MIQECEVNRENAGMRHSLARPSREASLPPPAPFTSCNSRASNRKRSSRHADVHDLIAQRAARHADLHLLADLLAQKALPARACGEDLVLVVVLVAGPDELVDLQLAGVEVL